MYMTSRGCVLGNAGSTPDHTGQFQQGVSMNVYLVCTTIDLGYHVVEVHLDYGKALKRVDELNQEEMNNNPFLKRGSHFLENHTAVYSA